VYDPKARLRRFFQYGGDYILLNDEAHNLIDRARDMFSAGLYRSDFVSLRRELGKKHPLYKRMGAIAKEILKILKPGGEENGRPALCLNEPPQSLLPLLLDFAAECDTALKALSGEISPHTEALMNLYFGVLDYLRVSEFFGENYTFFREPSHGFIRLYCLDPSALLAEEQKKSRACVFFSATLTPLPYFRAVLGGAPEDYTLRLASPFPRENLCLLIDRRISTRYKDRAGGYEKIAERLHEMMDGRTGNYMAFFPSYAYLSEVLSIFRERFPHVRTLAQTQEMNDENREGFLAEFLDGPKETLLAFAVMGGIFSEGIDLKGERLTGAAVVGVGLPMITEARNVLMDYYNRLSDTGFAFAYQYPGMNKVLQAAGRVIRTETDKGVVLLIDSRFAESTYRALFPPEWEGFSYIKDGNDLKNKLRDFWASHDGTGGLQGRRSGSPVTHD
jgi:DNA excision repair protein ERCC-2